MIRGFLVTLTSIIFGGYLFVEYGTSSSFWPGIPIVLLIIVGSCIGLALLTEAVNES